MTLLEDQKLLEAIALFILLCVASNMVDLYPQITRIVLLRLHQRNWPMWNAKPLRQKENLLGVLVGNKPNFQGSPLILAQEAVCIQSTQASMCEDWHTILHIYHDA